MRFHEVDVKGNFYVERLDGSLPLFSSIYIGRIFYLVDYNKTYVGFTEGWRELVSEVIPATTSDIGQAELATINECISGSSTTTLVTPSGFSEMLGIYDNGFPIVSSIESGNGSISPLGTNSIRWLRNQTYEMIPAHKWYVSDVIVDGLRIEGYTSIHTPYSAIKYHTFTNVNEPHTISAFFLHYPSHAITASTVGSVSVTPVGTTIVEWDDNLEYHITPSYTYRLVNVKVDNIVVTTIPGTSNDYYYRFQNVTADHNILATTVKRDNLVVVLNVATGGYVQAMYGTGLSDTYGTAWGPSYNYLVNGGVGVPYGSYLRIMINDTGSHIISYVTVNGVTVPLIDDPYPGGWGFKSYEIPNVTNSMSINVYFS